MRVESGAALRVVKENARPVPDGRRLIKREERT